MVTTHPPRTIVEPTALGTVANTDTKMLIYSLFQKGRVLAQDGDSLGLLEGGAAAPLQLSPYGSNLEPSYESTRPSVGYDPFLVSLIHDMKKGSPDFILGRGSPLAVCW